MRLAPLLLLPVAVLLAGGCSSMSARDCEDADWEMLGEADGDRGHGPEQFERRAADCARHQIAADETAYRRGYAGGIEDYCTLAGGVAAGRDGAGYTGACAGHDEAEFMQGYRAGRRLYDARTDYDRLRARLVSIDRLLDNPLSTSEQRRALLTEQVRLRQRIISAEDAVERQQRAIDALLRGTSPVPSRETP